MPNITETNAKQYSPLALAYIGDCVNELNVRTRDISEHPTMPAHKLHLQTVKYVKAQAQSNSIHAMIDSLTEDEQSVFRRGRNAKSYTSAKNASISDYRHATGFEALIGYLYLCGKQERMEELMKSAYENALNNPA